MSQRKVLISSMLLVLQLKQREHQKIIGVEVIPSLTWFILLSKHSTYKRSVEICSLLFKNKNTINFTSPQRKAKCELL